MAQAQHEYGKSSDAGDIIVRAGLSAFPYLSRRGEWEIASMMLQQVARVDKGPATVSALLPRIRRVVGATTGTERELTSRGLLARFLQLAGRMQEAEAEIRAVVARAVEREEFGLASAAAGDLVVLLRDTGRFREALSVIEAMTEHTKRAGFEPSTQLGDEASRLQILMLLGENEEVLLGVSELYERMKSLPDPAGPNETVPIWNVREMILDVGRESAMRLERWQEALDFAHEVFLSKETRGAPPLERAQTAFNNYGPLLSLKRYAEVAKLLHYCREVFENANSAPGLGKVFSALANLESEIGHPETAQHFEETSLRFKYIAGDPESVGISHSNLSIYIEKSGNEQCEALVNRLAGVLIAITMQSGLAARGFAALASDLQQAGSTGGGDLPVDFAALCATVEKIEGVRFRDLMERLAGGTAACDQIFQQVVAAALEGVSKSEPRHE